MSVRATGIIGIAGWLFLLPVTGHAAVTFTSDGIAPYVSSIAVRHGSEFVSPGTKTSGNVTVVVSIESLGKSVTMDTPVSSDSYMFTDNGSYTFAFHDQDGATGSSTITVDTIDRTPPVISVDPYSTTATQSDVVITVSTNEGTLNASTHTFTDNDSFDFVATDEAGNVATSTVTISHIDRVAPAVTLLGQASLQLRAGSTYTEEGVTATDAYDGALTPVVTGSVDTGTTGTYTLTYTATDTAGNAASVSRQVEIVRSSGGGGGGSRSVRTVSSEQELVGRVLGASTYNFETDLAHGSRGAEVTALQEALAARGFFAETPTGYFGEKTEAGLKAFQASEGIPQTGIVGPRTRAALMGSVAPTTLSIHAQIAQLQAQLIVLQQKLAALTGAGV